jgi:hypothetical protein
MNWLSFTVVVVAVLVGICASAFLGCAWLGAQWRYQLDSWAPDMAGGEGE